MRSLYFVVEIKENFGINRKEKLNLWNSGNFVNSLTKYMSLGMGCTIKFLLV